jgi:hypothetical protein
LSHDLCPLTLRISLSFATNPEIRITVAAKTCVLSVAHHPVGQRRQGIASRGQLGEKWEPYYETGIVETARNSKKETNMPIILWFLGVPLVLVVLLMLTHVI